MERSTAKQDDADAKKGEPGSPAKSSSSSSSVAEVVLWSHSEDSSDECDETVKSMLDFKSSKFSPTLALKCRLEDVPVAEGAKKYLNLQQYSKAVQSPTKSPRKDVAHVRKISVEELRQKSKESGPGKKNEGPAPSTSSAANPANYPIPGRRFLPHQLPVYRPRKEHPNTITLMHTVDGPLSVLSRVMKEKTRIKIWTRDDKGFRGFLTGFVEAFDKHWNIALRDVDEQFVRKKVIKFPIMGDSVSEKSCKITPQDQEEAGAASQTVLDAKGNSNNDENEDRRQKEQAISSAFIRLKNYLRQNDGMARKRMGPGVSTAAVVPKQTNKNQSAQKRKNVSKDTATKSKTVYVGDMDPLSICRTGLANLSLRDDIHQHPLKKQNVSAPKSPPPAASKRKSTKNKMMTEPDIIQCHQTISTRSKSAGERCSSSTSAATTTSSSASTSSTQQHQQHPLPSTISRTSLSKKSLTIFKTPCEDSFGFMVVAQTRKYELVERHVGQVLLMGNDIVFIETSC